MNLDEKLRVMVLQEFGFSEAIKDNTILDTDLKIIQKSTNDEMIQEGIINIFKSRIHSRVIRNITKYHNFKHLNGFAAARARLHYQGELRELLGVEKYLSNTDKQEIETILTK